MKNSPAKPSLDPITQVNIAAYLAKHDDFALELRCAKTLKELGWDFRHT